MSAPVCAYKDNTQIRCEGRLAMFTAHDGRGCRHVCINHAKWLADASCIYGHSSSCPENEAQTVQQSVTNAIANYIEVNFKPMFPSAAHPYIDGLLRQLREGRWAS